MRFASPSLAPLFALLVPTLGLTAAACTDDATDERAAEDTDAGGDEVTADGTSSSDSESGESSSEGETTTETDSSTDAETTEEESAEESADETESSTGETTETETTGQICDPGEVTCFDADNTQMCNEEGSDWDPPVPCPDSTECVAGECIDSCTLAELNPSSVGCSFFANRMDNLHADQPDSLVIGNVSSDDPVTAQLYFVPNDSNTEQAQGAPVVIPPQATHTFELNNAQIESVTTVRTGGVYRVETDNPVVAYVHSPIGSQATNDASMILPEHALTGNYVVASWPGTFSAHYPSYFTAIAINDGTNLEFVAGSPTAGGGGVPALQMGGSTSVALDRYDTLNVVVAQQYQDLSGTVITADQPVWLAGASECANVPMYPAVLYCDHLEELMLPLEYWGDEYVGAHAPQRGNESYHWRVYSGEDGVTIDTTPSQPGFPVTLDKGEYHQFATQESFIFSGSGPFLPVQYLEGQSGGAGTGDPSMYQMVPTEQFLDAYAFVTGTNYTQHYAQIVRPAGGADVTVDGQTVTDFYTVGAWEIADFAVSEGAHFATSEQPFGVTQVGYTSVTSYAYPGGLKLAVINPQ
ncbi:hypothetical protein PPSIR1_05753 [Plesiocystis pacifica SIR-1]|uniref:IgGFc-binding protein N-terminal domain-containing protein n=1 Tax=Plesiocystis pacifica SIR-1 TaxID=391625 RepID=A6FXC3_9BACT|nr:IgGFc-binding protein [Plesiocystis pacifica]EDM81947.1 hypothetical protein PPSIR1_05753 [Plesiocystis pacifica SIR-1]